jgi:hypothetical protein
MKRTEVVRFIISACSYIRLSQAKTLSNLVAAAMKLTRASLAELGRALANKNGVAIARSNKLSTFFLEILKILSKYISLSCHTIGFLRRGKEQERGELIILCGFVNGVFCYL